MATERLRQLPAVTSAAARGGQAHIGILMPRLTSQTLAGHDVAYPMTMPICMRSQ
jgi:hypothetical protein